MEEQSSVVGKTKMETKYIDFHTHTRLYSDGGFTPAEVVEKSSRRGINILAITDHDNQRGYHDARQLAKKKGMILIPGAELTTPKYHLLALNFNPHDEKFQEFLEYSRGLQNGACKERVEILKGEGIPITMEKINAEVPYVGVGKGNIRSVMRKDPECIEYLAKKHPGLSEKEVYFYYMGRDGIASNLEPRAGLAPQEAIDAVHAAGGIIGIAHPPKDIDEMEELELLVKQGIDFLEIQPMFKNDFPYHIYEEFAEQNGLPVSYGSDFHDPDMGRPMLEKGGENILSPKLAEILNGGFIKIQIKETREVLKV